MIELDAIGRAECRCRDVCAHQGEIEGPPWIDHGGSYAGPF
jgi:hypothetical protein